MRTVDRYLRLVLISLAWGGICFLPETAVGVSLTSLDFSNIIRLDENHQPPVVQESTFLGQAASGPIDTSVRGTYTLTSGLSFSNTVPGLGSVTAAGQYTVTSYINSQGFWAGKNSFNYTLTADIGEVGPGPRPQMSLRATPRTEFNFAYEGSATQCWITGGQTNCGVPRSGSQVGSMGASDIVNAVFSLDSQTTQGTMRQISRLEGDGGGPPGTTSLPFGSETGFNPPVNNTVDGSYFDNDVPSQAQSPVDIAGINLTALESGDELAASMHGEESTYVMAQFGNPVISGGYGDTELVYHRGINDEPSDSEKFVSGYLMMNNGGGNFTSFTVPEALAGGDNAFRINVDGIGHDLAAGAVFDFTALDPTGVDAFVLADIDEVEMLDPQGEIPFTFGVTAVAGSDASFLAVPLVPVTPGDFNRDGEVNGADFLAWQRGESNNPLSADDLADWQMNYGTGSSPASIVGVPEPSGLLMLSLLGVCAMVLFHRRELLALPA